MLFHPVNGKQEQTQTGFSWPAFLFGVIWLLIKGLYGHFLINFVLIIITAGFAAPVIWLVYGFIGNKAYKSSLLKKGYLNREQWEKKEKISDLVGDNFLSAHKKDSITQLKELAELRDKGILTNEEFIKQKDKIINANQ